MVAKPQPKASPEARAAAEKALRMASVKQMLAKDPLFSRRARNALRLHEGQRQIVREAKRFNVLCCGRRYGKTLFGADLLAETGLTAQAPAGYFAPTYKHLEEGWRALTAQLGGAIRHQNANQHRLELHKGGVVEGWSLDGDQGGHKKQYRAARSRKYKRVVIDEAALVESLEDVFNQAIGPTLIDLKGDAWFLS